MKKVVFLLVLVVVWLVVLCLIANAQEQPAVGGDTAVTVAEENPLSAWICLRAEVDKHWNAVGRYAEVFLTRGNLVPADIYYYDVGDTGYQEVGFCIGYKVGSLSGLNFWALPYFVIAEDSHYWGPCTLVQGSWGRWVFQALPMVYVPLESEGISQFASCTNYLDYRLNDWLEVGIGGTVYWADTGGEEWQWKVGPNIIIKDPIKLFGGTGDINLRATWDQDGEFMLRVQKTFSF